MSNSKLSADGYEKLKSFMGLYVDWFFPRVGKPENHPSIFIANLEKESMANARRGVQMAINDMVENSSGWSSEQVAVADARFAAQGTFTLSEIRRSYSKKYAQILKRGLIRSETEYYLVKGVRDGCSGIAALESQQLEDLLAAYEAQITSVKPSKPRM